MRGSYAPRCCMTLIGRGEMCPRRGFCDGGSKMPRARASPLHCRIRDALEPESRVKRLTWQGHSDGGIDAKANDVLRAGHSLHAARNYFGRPRKQALPSLRPMSARRSRVHPRPRAAIGTTASTARISGTVGTSDPKVQRCVRKHAKSRRACHHQRRRRGARMLLKRLA